MALNVLKRRVLEYALQNFRVFPRYAKSAREHARAITDTLYQSQDMVEVEVSIIIKFVSIINTYGFLKHVFQIIIINVNTT